MPLSIPNTTLQDAYTDATTFGGTDVFQWGFVTVANNPAFVQLLEGRHGQAVPQPEVYCPPATYPLAPGGRSISGIRARNALAGAPAQFFGSLFYPNEPGIQAGTPFTGIISPSGAIGAVGVINKDTSLIDVTASAAETDIYNFSIPAGSLTSDGYLRLRMSGDFLYNRLAGDTCRIRIYLGNLAVPILDDSPSSSVIAAARQPWYLDLRVYALGSQTSQLVQAELRTIQPDTPAPTAGIGSFEFRNDFVIEGGLLGQGVPGTVDMSLAQSLKVTAAWSVASANNSWRKRYAVLEAVS